MPLGPRDFLLGVALPALAALLLLVLARRGWRREDALVSVRGGRWAAPIAIGLAVLIALPAIIGSFKFFPPRESMNWFFYVAIFAALLGAIDGQFNLPHGVRSVLMFFTILASCAAILHYKFSPDPFAPPAILLAAAIAVIGLMWWMVIDHCERDVQTFLAAPINVSLLAAGSGVTIAFFGGLKFGQLCGAIAGATGAAALVTLIFRRPTLLRGSAIILSTLLVLIIFDAIDLADLPRRYAIALLALPLSMAVGRLLPVSRRAPWIRNILRIAPTGLMVAIILFFAARAFLKLQREQSETDPYALAPRFLSTSAGVRDI